MKQRLLELLRCPVSLHPLEMTVFEPADGAEGIASGVLRCRCGAKFPIWQGVPRLLMPGDRSIPEGYLQQFRDRIREFAPEFLEEEARQGRKQKFTFDVQWSMYEYSELTWEHDLPSRVEKVYRYLGIPRGSMNEWLVLDAGCGNGTLSAGLAASGAEVIAMDYSESVERAERVKGRYAGLAADRVHFVQGDVQRPPFSPDTFDVVYSDGVLHHTPSTRRSFEALAPLVRPGGYYFVWVYRADAKFPYNWKLRTAKTLQAILRPLPLEVMRGVCFVGAAGLLVRRRVQHFFGNRKRPIIPLRLKAVNLFDTLTPRNYHLHTPDEVQQWFLANGFSNPMDASVEGLSDAGFGMTAIREVKGQGFKVLAASA